MESSSTLDQPPMSGSVPVAEAGGESKSAELDVEQSLQQNNPTRTSQESVSAALTAVRVEGGAALASGARVPVEDGGRGGGCMAEMAQRDLDAALQLLADRAQYITGATGAAIALRRDGKNDMLCRASAGSNAPELGALLSTEFGLSGESVRTRQPLRCDDAERDARVNREVCRQLGIASVVVMPVVNDDGVLGVFELFSGKANAFGERDLSAVQRLGEMVETAVRLAKAAEGLQERLKTNELSAPGIVAAGAHEISEDEILEEPVPEFSIPDAPVRSQELRSQEEAGKLGLDTQVFGNQVLDNTVLDGAATEKPVRADPKPDLELSVPSAPAALSKEIVADEPEVVVAPAPAAAAVPPPEPIREKKQLFWSASLKPLAQEAGPKQSDQSHVPPVLRGLHKCEACGFPVSAGRVLCVECEEKKWRGQLRTPQAAARQSAVPVTAVTLSKATSKPAERAFAAVPQSVGAIAVASPESTAPARATEPVRKSAASTSQALAGKESAKVGGSPVPAVAAQDTSATLVLSAGLPSSQSWLSANRYIVGALVAVAAVLGAFLLLR